MDNLSGSNQRPRKFVQYVIISNVCGVILRFLLSTDVFAQGMISVRDQLCVLYPGKTCEYHVFMAVTTVTELPGRWHELATDSAEDFRLT